MSELNELAAALAKAQGRIHPAPKDADNPFFKSKYASLPAVREAMQAAFAENGLSVVQIPEVVDGQLRLRTILMHSSGQTLDCGALIADVDLSNPQKIGSAITYFRRYSLAAISQTVADDDDDGNAASQPKKGQSNKEWAEQKSTPRQKSGPPLSTQHIAELTELINSAPDAEALAAIGKSKTYQQLKANGPADKYATVANLAKAKHALLTTQGEDHAASDS